MESLVYLLCALAVAVIAAALSVNLINITIGYSLDLVTLFEWKFSMIILFIVLLLALLLAAAQSSALARSSVIQLLHGEVSGGYNRIFVRKGILIGQLAILFFVIIFACHIFWQVDHFT